MIPVDLDDVSEQDLIIDEEANSPSSAPMSPSASTQSNNEVQSSHESEKMTIDEEGKIKFASILLTSHRHSHTIYQRTVSMLY